MRAAYYGLNHIIEVLVDAGAEVNAQNEVRQGNHLISTSDPYIAQQDGKTALMQATLEGYAKTMSLLLSYGADVNASDDVWLL